jgi:hypothetical protein
VLPILPGWVFLGLAALMLFPQARLAQKALGKIEERFPRLGRAVRKVMES